MHGLRIIAGATIMLSALTACGAIAQETRCYDAAVYGRAVQQLAADIPPSCNDCIVMQSPYLVDLKVTRIWEGEVRKGRLTVVRMQHSRYGAGYQTWYLRRNTAGGFNALRYDVASPPPRCAAGAAAAAPLLTLPEGKTLDDLLREAVGKRRAR